MHTIFVYENVLTLVVVAWGSVTSWRVLCLVLCGWSLSSKNKLWKHEPGMIGAALKQLHAGCLHSRAACDACDKAAGLYVLIKKGSKVSVHNMHKTKTWHIFTMDIFCSIWFFFFEYYFLKTNSQVTNLFDLTVWIFLIRHSREKHFFLF